MVHYDKRQIHNAQTKKMLQLLNFGWSLNNSGQDLQTN